MTDRPRSPDYAFASASLRIANFIGFALRTGLTRSQLQQWRSHFDAIDQAITGRGARFSELEAAINAVRRHESILSDLPSGQTAPPAVTSDFEAGYAKGRADERAINDELTVREKPPMPLR